MYTKELLPILKEFRGKKSFIRLINGDTISGAVGELQNDNPYTADKKPLVSVMDDTNHKTIIYLSNIIALRLL
jgi:hypothetical protein